MSSSPKAEFLIPGGLLLLSFVPVVAGTFRVAQFAGGAEITADNARIKHRGSRGSLRGLAGIFRSPALS